MWKCNKVRGSSERTQQPNLGASGPGRLPTPLEQRRAWTARGEAPPAQFSKKTADRRGQQIDVSTPNGFLPLEQRHSISIRKGIVQLTVFSLTPTWAVTLPMESISPDKMIKYAWTVLKRQELIKGKALNLLSSKPNVISFRFWWPSFRSISSKKSCQKKPEGLYQSLELLLRDFQWSQYLIMPMQSLINH